MAQAISEAGTPAQRLVVAALEAEAALWADDTEALAEAHGLDVELHGGSLVHRHCMASLRNTNYYELGLVHPKVHDNKPPIYADRRWLDELDSVDEDGCVAVPDGPGLGVPFDWDFIAAHKVGETVYE